LADLNVLAHKFMQRKTGHTPLQ